MVTQEHVADGRFEPVIERLFELALVDYIQVNSTTAGCYTFRIERGRYGIERIRGMAMSQAKTKKEVIVRKPLLTVELDPPKTTNRIEKSITQKRTPS